MTLARRFAAPAAAALALLVIAGCSSSSGLSDDPLDLPEPAIVAGDPTPACAAGSTATVQLDLTRTTVVLGYGGPATRPANHVAVAGTVTGLPAGDEVTVVVIPSDSACSIASATVAVVDASGAFTVFANILLEERFRVVAIAGPATASPTCAASGCLDLEDGTGPVGASGISNTIDVRID